MTPLPRPHSSGQPGCVWPREHVLERKSATTSTNVQRPRRRSSIIIHHSSIIRMTMTTNEPPRQVDKTIIGAHCPPTTLTHSHTNTNTHFLHRKSGTRIAGRTEEGRGKNRKQILGNFVLFIFCNKAFLVFYSFLGVGGVACPSARMDRMMGTWHVRIGLFSRLWFLLTVVRCPPSIHPSILDRTFRDIFFREGGGVGHACINDGRATSEAVWFFPGQPWEEIPLDVESFFTAEQSWDVGRQAYGCVGCMGCTGVMRMQGRAVEPCA